MKISIGMIAMAVLSLTASITVAQEQPKVAVDAPGLFVRIGATPDGWVTLGYRLANDSVGQEWMLLEVVLALPGGTPRHTLKRTDIALVAPGPKVVQLATQPEYQKANYLMALNRRGDIARDPINYVPNNATASRPLNFFGDPSKPGTAALGRDQLELSDNFSAFGRLYFKVPGGIQRGQHFLEVRFANSAVKVPFKIVTKEGAKELEKEIEEIKKKRQEAQEKK